MYVRCFTFVTFSKLKMLLKVALCPTAQLMQKLPFSWEKDKILLNLSKFIV